MYLGADLPFSPSMWTLVLGREARLNGSLSPCGAREGFTGRLESVWHLVKECQSEESRQEVMSREQ